MLSGLNEISKLAINLKGVYSALLGNTRKLLFGEYKKLLLGF